MRTKRAFLGVIGAALLLKLVLVWASHGVGLQIEDEQDYARIATNITEGNGFAHGPGLPTSIRPPLYPGFVAAIWSLSGSRSLEAVRIAQVAVSIVSIVVVYLIACRMFDERAAVVASALFAFYPSLLVSGVLILTETLFIFLMVLAVYGLIRLMDDSAAPTTSRNPGAERHDRVGWAILSGVALGLAALTRSVLWPFVFVLVPFLWFATVGNARRRMVLCAAVVAGYAITIAPWAVRNTRLQKTLTFVDTMSGINLLTGNYEYTPEDRMWDGVGIVGPHGWYAPMLGAFPGRVPTEGEKDKWARSAAIRYAVAHPMTTARRSLLKLADLWGLEREWISGLQHGLYAPPRWFAVSSTVLVLVAYPAVLFLAIGGFFLVEDRDARARWLLVLLTAFICFAHAATFGHSRYHLPIVPILTIYAAAAITHWSSLARSISWRQTLVPMSLALLCVAVWTREVLFRDAEHIAKLFAALQHL